MPLNHFTDRIDAIVSSESLFGSTGHTAVFGDGVYFTAQAPYVGKVPVAKNNWNGIWEQAPDGGKIERGGQDSR